MARVTGPFLGRIASETLQLFEDKSLFSSCLLESSLNQDINEIKLSIFGFVISKNPLFPRTLYH